jgi:hypothetical protein
MSEIYLKQLLLPDASGAQQLVLDTSETRAELHKVHDRIGEQIAHGSWAGIRSRLFEHLEDLLEVPLGPILAGGWNKLRQVREVIGRQVESGAQTVEEVALFDHTLKSTHQPQLQLFMNGELISTLTLTVEIKLQLHGVMLQIQHGSITGVKTGQCSGKGALLFAGALLHESKIPAFHLPGRVSIPAKRQAHTGQLELLAGAGGSHQDNKSSGSRWWLFYLLAGLLLLAAALYLWRWP